MNSESFYGTSRKTRSRIEMKLEIAAQDSEIESGSSDEGEELNGPDFSIEQYETGNY